MQLKNMYHQTYCILLPISPATHDSTPFSSWLRNDKSISFSGSPIKIALLVKFGFLCDIVFEDPQIYLPTVFRD